MKKNILALSIITLLSGNAIAADQVTDADINLAADQQADVDIDLTAQKQGARYSFPVGPFYDPIIGAGVAFIPTAVYNTTEGAAPSKTFASFIYSSSKSWITELGTENYFGSDSQWFLDASFSYSYAEIDFTNFMQPIIGGGATSELNQYTLKTDLSIAYKIFNNTYFGPYIQYRDIQQDRFESDPYASSNMMADITEFNYGATLTYDGRNNKFDTTDGFYMSLNGKKVTRESTGANVLSDPNTGEDIINQNGDTDYLSVTADLRGYFPISNKTTFATRVQGNWNDDEALDTTATLMAVANGFTHESGGRSAAGIDLELRHWFTDRWGMMAGVSAAKPFETGLRDDDARYAVLAGLRYMLLPEDGLSARLDVGYNTQDEDNIIGYFNVGQTF